MTLTQHEPMMSERIEALGLRMLDGGAAAQVRAYRLGEEFSCAAHAIVDGQLLVACVVTEGRLAGLPAGEAVAVRLDLNKQAPFAFPSIEVASAHMLADLVWLSDEEVAACYSRLPELLRIPLEVAGGRIGMLIGDRLVVHDFSGVSALPLGRRLPNAAPQPDAITACDDVLALGEERLRNLCWRVMTGSQAGAISFTQVDGQICGGLANKVFCVDVDLIGITLITTGTREIATVFVQFDEQVTTQEAFRAQIARLN